MASCSFWGQSCWWCVEGSFSWEDGVSDQVVTGAGVPLESRINMAWRFLCDSWTSGRWSRGESWSQVLSCFNSNACRRTKSWWSHHALFQFEPSSESSGMALEVQRLPAETKRSTARACSRWYWGCWGVCCSLCSTNSISAGASGLKSRQEPEPSKFCLQFGALAECQWCSEGWRETAGGSYWWWGQASCLSPSKSSFVKLDCQWCSLQPVEALRSRTCYVCSKESVLDPEVSNAGQTDTEKMCSLQETPWSTGRVVPGKPPFSSVGIDCFGPFFVKSGWSQEKRYGCIFSCSAVRAIHIEMLHSLESDSFLNALMRFVAWRGKPEMIRSDNGTNFVGGNSELVESVKQWENLPW